MQYATQDDLVPLRMTLTDLVELTDDTESDDEEGAGEVNTAVVTGKLVEASGMVDAYCRQRYVTPLQASEMVKSLTLDIAIYKLFTRRRTTKPNETVAQVYEQAVKFLKDVAAGAASLDQPATATQPQQGSGGATVSRKPQAFDNRNLGGWDRH